MEGMFPFSSKLSVTGGLSCSAEDRCGGGDEFSPWASNLDLEP